MADRNCSSHSSPTSVIVSSVSDQIKSSTDESNSLSNSIGSKNVVEKNCSSSDDSVSCKYQPPQSNSKLLYNDIPITNFSEKKNEVSDKNEKDNANKSTSFLRPSILSSGFSFSSKTPDFCKADSIFSLRSSKLSLAASKFGDTSFTTPSTNVLSTSISSNNPKELSSNLAEEVTNKSDSNTDKKSAIGVISSILNPNSNTLSSPTPKTSGITVPNFVFGQNLHERVTDSVKSTNTKEKAPETKSNGTSNMLFTSVLTSKEVKENFTSDKLSSSKDSSSLIEDAARCQEARSNKRKYEEVLVTTGEEDEQNILQVNVKLFAFDNGTWVERGRGILRLNDKNENEGTSSRVVIRTVGSLRVVLNTKIWSGMSLNRASERSARLTAMDPNGQIKIFLIQASLKDMIQLYPLLEERIKLCKQQDLVSEESPQKKLALEKDKM